MGMNENPYKGVVIISRKHLSTISMIEIMERGTIA